MGVLFSIIYVLFSIRQNILCWPALIIAAVFNFYAYYLINLPLQSIMQLFFILTAFYGWHKWRKSQEKTTLLVNSWQIKSHLTWLTIGLISTLAIGFFLKSINNNSIFHSSYPFLDALMFVFNIIPMYMTGKKILESWIYFIVIDIISGIFYAITGEFFFCFLFFCYIGFATQGYLTWKKEIS
tara:strand:- start:58 stop:606 length:549 start_codon:yes stop_codon:yes gene_type:complete